jgi:hypothetical protein
VNSRSFEGKMLSNGGPYFRENEQGVLYFWERICVPSVGSLRKQILEEAHWSKYSIHPGKVKMYKDLRMVY